MNPSKAGAAVLNYLPLSDFTPEFVVSTRLIHARCYLPFWSEYMSPTPMLPLRTFMLTLRRSHQACRLPFASMYPRRHWCGECTHSCCTCHVVSASAVNAHERTCTSIHALWPGPVGSCYYSPCSCFGTRACATAMLPQCCLHKVMQTLTIIPRKSKARVEWHLQSATDQLSTARPGCTKRSSRHHHTPRFPFCHCITLGIAERDRRHPHDTPPRHHARTR